MMTREKRKIFLNDNDLLNSIRIIISNSTKKKSKEIIKIVLSEKKFFPSDDLVNRILKEIISFNDNEIGEIYFNLHNKLLRKHDLLGEKIKDRIPFLIKERLGITNEIQRIFDENDLQLLRDLVYRTTKVPEKTNDFMTDTINTTHKLSGSNPPFLLFTLFYQYHRSIYFDSVLWNFIKILPTDDKNKKTNTIKLKEPPKEIFHQMHLILPRKYGIKQIKKYFKTIGPYYESYFKVKIENEENEGKIFYEKQQNLHNKNEIDQLKSNILSLQTHIKELEEHIQNMQTELETKTKEYKIDLEKQRDRNNEILYMEKKSLFNNIKKDVQFCFNEIKIGLDRDSDSITRENIDLILQRIEKTEKYLNEVGESL